MPKLHERLPFLHTAQKRALLERVQSCGPAIEKELKLQPGSIMRSQTLGCGYYGCVFKPMQISADGAWDEPTLGNDVLKITADNLEAATVEMLLELQDSGEELPQGLVQYKKIWLLGNCSRRPKERTFVYREPPTYNFMGRTPGHQKWWRGPGAPYRPYWLIRREELDNVQEHVKGVRRLNGLLWKLKVARGEHPEFDDAWLTADATLVLRAEYKAGELLDALMWLDNFNIKFGDYTKIANLGWREGTGLVIRDIGFAETDGGMPDFQQLGRLR